MSEQKMEPTELRVSFKRDSLYIAGSYCKYSRFLSQSPFSLSGKRVRASSVQEVLCLPLISLFDASGSGFLTAGREDIDVRMLGKGRPFGIILKNPKRKYGDKIGEVLKKYSEDLFKSQSDVRALGVELACPERLKILKLGEQDKTKSYTALCYARNGINAEGMEKLNELGKKVLTMAQRTPVRVLHRRNLNTRHKNVLKMSAMLIDHHHFYLRVTTQAGTYIKEFVHGDWGRTVPSVSDLVGCEVEILELDVESVDLQWPLNAAWTPPPPKK